MTRKCCILTCIIIHLILVQFILVKILLVRVKLCRFISLYLIKSYIVSTFSAYHDRHIKVSIAELNWSRIQHILYTVLLARSQQYCLSFVKPNPKLSITSWNTQWRHVLIWINRRVTWCSFALKTPLSCLSGAVDHDHLLSLTHRYVVCAPRTSVVY